MKYRICLFFIFKWLFIQWAVAQLPPPKVKENKDEIALKRYDFSYLTALGRLGNHYLAIHQPDSAFPYMTEGIRIIKSDTSYSRRLLWYMTDLTRYYMAKGDLPKALSLTHELVDTLQQRRKIALMGLAYFCQGYYVKRWYQNYKVSIPLSISYLDSSVYYYGLAKDPRLYQAKNEIVDSYRLLNDLDSAERKGKELLDEVLAANNDLVGQVHFQLSLIAQARGKYNVALYHILESRKYVEKTVADFSLVEVYGAISTINQALGRNKESTEYASKAMALAEKLMIEWASQVTNGRANYYYYVIEALDLQLKSGKIKESKKLIDYVLTTYPPENNMLLAEAAQMKAYYAEAIGNTKQAEREYMVMVSLYRNIFRVEMGGLYEKAFNDASEFLISQKKYKQALPILEDALAGKITPPLPLHQIKTHYLMAKVDSADQRYLAGMKHLQEQKRLSDSIFEHRKAKEIEELQVKFEVKEKEMEIKNLQEGQQQHVANLKQASVIRNVILVVIGVTFVIILLLINRSRIKKKSHDALELKNQETDMQNETLRKIVGEKEWMIREIHHRVKNNLHMITSLLGSQTYQLKDNAARVAVQDSHHRIQAMSMVHQKLYLDSNISEVDLSIYFTDLVNYLEDSFQQQNIKFCLRAQPIMITAGQAISIGLIVNELITNSIKYAFPNNRKGMITVEVEKQGEELKLIIADDGVGLPADIDMDRPKSLGMRLVKGLCEELHANYEIKNEHGMKSFIRFVPLSVAS